MTDYREADETDAEVLVLEAARIVQYVLATKEDKSTWAEAGYSSAEAAARVLVGDGYRKDVTDLAVQILAEELELQAEMES